MTAKITNIKKSSMILVLTYIFNKKEFNNTSVGPFIYIKYRPAIVLLNFYSYKINNKTVL